MFPTDHDYKEVVPAILDLTDSIIKLLHATSNRSTHTNHTISSLRTLLLRERKTVQRQNCIIADLRAKLSGVEAQLCAVQQSLTQSSVEQKVKVEEKEEEEKEELGQMDERRPREEELSAQAAASTLYDLQNIYSRMAERYAPDLSRKEAEEDSDWTENS
ncbi:hypothetical protein M436DRAFT_78306 [Aureobasidium namibiae CBS 147.97]|uniref:Mediator of RNA polymerase II transcription subunit 4 n=1 Tax=Aureobasidium namibiae CBS 147.97 TaxID=1043004 RepID=A0A074X3G7_9PEZI